MFFERLADLADALPRGGRLLGLDVGDKTVGVAISDPSLMLASPLKTIERGKKLAPVLASLKDLIKGEQVAGLVSGLPVGMDGTEGPRAQATRDVMREISRALDLPAAFWDERLSTSAVERFLIGEADMTRKRRKEVVDKMAAAYILQGALDSLGPRFS